MDKQCNGWCNSVNDSTNHSDNCQVAVPAIKAERDQLRTEVERLKAERDSKTSTHVWVHADTLRTVRVELEVANLQISAAEDILGDVPHLFKDGPENGKCVEECPGCRSVDYFDKFTEKKEEPQPIGKCAKGLHDIYAKEGFCGACEPWKR